jgi:hypothetical protein
LLTGEHSLNYFDELDVSSMKVYLSQKPFQPIRAAVQYPEVIRLNSAQTIAVATATFNDSVVSFEEG